MGHINPATVRIDRDLLNSATALISQDPQKLTPVRMRNGLIIEVYVSFAQSEFESDVIRDLPFNHCWQLSGHSVINSDYDIVEVLTS